MEQTLKRLGADFESWKKNDGTKDGLDKLYFRNAIIDWIQGQECRVITTKYLEAYIIVYNFGLKHLIIDFENKTVNFDKYCFNELFDNFSMFIYKPK